MNVDLGKLGEAPRNIVNILKIDVRCDLNSLYYLFDNPAMNIGGQIQIVGRSFSSD